MELKTEYLFGKRLLLYIFFNLQNYANITVKSSYMSLNVRGVFAEKFVKTFNRYMTLSSAMKTISSLYNFKIFLFVKHGDESYVKLDPTDELLDDLFIDGDTIYLSAVGFNKNELNVNHKGTTLFKYGYTDFECVRSAKLRIQLLTGVPYKSLKFSYNDFDDRKLTPGTRIIEII